jgi:hypothetical protein
MKKEKLNTEESANSDLAAVISRLVELAKAEYGEFEQEFMGYKVGNYWTEEYEWADIDLITQEQMDSFKNNDTELNNIVGISMKELHHLLETDLQYYNFDDNISVKRCYKVLNKGWKRELLQLINGI